jgi:hypothetical protein
LLSPRWPRPTSAGADCGSGATLGVSIAITIAATMPASPSSDCQFKTTGGASDAHRRDSGRQNGDDCPAERARLQPRYRYSAHTVTPREIGLSSAFRKPLDRFLPLVHG